MVWVGNYPLSSTSGCASVTQITTNFSGVDTWWTIEHDTFSATTSGHHKAGKVGTLLYETTAAITGATAPGTGALGYSSDKGILYIYTSGGWKSIAQDYYSRVFKVFEAQTIPPTAWTQIISGSSTASGQYDTLGEYSSGTITVSAAGFYSLVGSIRWPLSTTSNYQQVTAIYVNGSLYSTGCLYGGHVGSVGVNDTLSASAGDTIKLYGYHTHTTSADIFRGSLMIHRIS